MKIIRMKTNKSLLPYVLGGIIVLTVFALGFCFVLALIFPLGTVMIASRLLDTMSFYTFGSAGVYFIFFFVFEFFHRQRPDRGSLHKDYVPPPKREKDVERRVPWEWSLFGSAFLLITATVFLSVLSVLPI